VADRLLDYTSAVEREAADSAPTLELEHGLLAQGCTTVAGVDEVGRGSWAGPLVAAAVVLPLSNARLLRRLAGARDSKKLAPETRLEIALIIAEVASAIGIGWATHHVVDSEGLTAANRSALLRAVARLSPQPDALVVDHFRLPECGLPQVCVPKADARSLSVACASIVAKVFRDRWMARCDSRFPGYDFSNHKGYGTPGHREALSTRGPSPLHRRSFEPIALLSQE
jgi:ribonuclease HII